MERKEVGLNVKVSEDARAAAKAEAAKRRITLAQWVEAVISANAGRPPENFIAAIGHWHRVPVDQEIIDRQMVRVTTGSINEGMYHDLDGPGILLNLLIGRQGGDLEVSLTVEQADQLRRSLADHVAGARRQSEDRP